MRRALIAMSGGVDSSVAAFLVKQKGIDAIGATMLLWEPAENGNPEEDGTEVLSFRYTRDMRDAAAVAEKLGIPYHVYVYKRCFEEKVILPFIRSYEEGLTPNPCVECNRYLKFGKLLDAALSGGCDAIVTGHYARVRRDADSGRYLLYKAKDLKKDQSYVLFSLSQDVLSHLLLPLGELGKEEVRRIAEENGFTNANKSESMDICFIPDGDYGAFIAAHGGKDAPGDFVDTGGNIRGTHKGITHYTIGQRKGLGLALPHPLYVMEKDAKKNRVILGENSDLFQESFLVTDVNWIPFAVPPDEVCCEVKIRYGAKPAAARAARVSETEYRVHFRDPQRALTPGQFAVFYQADLVLGGGRIL